METEDKQFSRQSKQHVQRPRGNLTARPGMGCQLSVWTPLCNESVGSLPNCSSWGFCQGTCKARNGYFWKVLRREVINYLGRGRGNPSMETKYGQSVQWLSLANGHNERLPGYRRFLWTSCSACVPAGDGVGIQGAFHGMIKILTCCPSHSHRTETYPSATESTGPEHSQQVPGD